MKTQSTPLSFWPKALGACLLHRLKGRPYSPIPGGHGQVWPGWPSLTMATMALFFLSNTNSVSGQTSPGGKQLIIQASIDGIQVTKGGQLRIMLFGDSGFPKQHDRAILTKVVPANESTITITLQAQPGTYALKVLHDENGNGKVDKKLVFIPAEGLGFSQGARIRFGPPSFKDARFELNKSGHTESITMQYL